MLGPANEKLNAAQSLLFCSGERYRTVAAVTRETIKRAMPRSGPHAVTASDAPPPTPTDPRYGQNRFT
jgi:hypothetical protein